MRKSSIILISSILAVTMTSGAALAKPDNSNGKSNKEEAQAAKPDNGPATKKAEDNANEKSKGNANSKADKAKEDTKEKEIEKEKDKDKDNGKNTVTTATYATYGNNGHNGYKGLFRAIENVKDKPAGAVIAELLLTKYNTELSAEAKAELEAIVEKDAALTALAAILNQKGSVTDAVYVQKEAILADVKNIESYKKLGKLYDQVNKKGIKLYVNGEETNTGVPPILTSGSTLVPFKAIAEALEAAVVWNAQERSVTVTRGDITVKLFIDKKTAYVNGKATTLQAAPAIVKGSTVVPARFVSEALKATVKWEPASQSVIIYNE
ncbi:copper amine oxidase [Paenibacillus sp. PK3_47]|uniref:copper amine oxidase N-terminal domain-containing protein n=1 Tax=Paenibacillus sp. PK3_47 TaxID=2072642 RepID=UPI00201D95B4|nr:copper amine oxidase N-terminal domain-containing protein [Paenibacillus sp. PK3_47]UQZ34899.1 copper amine oxidase [Paenibacillus sp. PK3_47]